MSRVYIILCNQSNISFLSEVGQCADISRTHWGYRCLWGCRCCGIGSPAVMSVPGRFINIIMKLSEKTLSKEDVQQF